MRQFTVAAEAPDAAPNEVGEVVDLGQMPDGFVLQVVRPKSALLIPLADVAIDGTKPEQFKATMNLLHSLLTAESNTYLFGRLNDVNDKMDVKDLAPIIESMTEVISGRPTGSPSDSSSAP